MDGMQVEDTDASGVALIPILIVEDSRVSAAHLRDLLHDIRLANPVVHLDHGELAVEWLDEPRQRAHPPALVLLDVHLPGRDGMAILRWARAQEELATVPVVILTATADRDDLDEAYDLGVHSYLVKPVGFDALSDILRHLPLRWALLPGPHG